MCGRFTLRTSGSAIAEFFSLKTTPVVLPRYNIAPTQLVPTIRLPPGPGSRQFELLRWGLIPSWAKDPAIGSKLINARVETVAEKPAFRDAFRHRRCLIVADGFYEWKPINGKKQPFLFYLKTGNPFALAGLWECRDQEKDPVVSCTILTTEANGLMHAYHERMPVILPSPRFEAWLDPQLREPERIQPWLLPYPAEEMAVHPVAPLVNSPKNDVPACVEPHQLDTFRGQIDQTTQT